MILFSVITVFIILIDQLIKLLIESNMHGQTIDIIENIFSFTYVENFGAAWGIMADNNWLLIIFTPLLILTIIYYLYKYRQGKYELILGAIVVGGAFGNYIDRLFRGYVVDYIDFKIWPVFNFADVCIVVGCILFSINLMTRSEEDGD